MPDISPDRLDFQAAIDYFSEKTNLDTDSWVEGQGIVQNSFFTVAGAKGHLLQDLRDAVATTQSSGGSTADFLKVFDRIADSYSPNWMGQGNRAWRGQLIYEQNIRQAHAAGRYAQMTDPIVKKLRPYWQWRHGDSRDPRPAHLALDRKVFPCDELPFHPGGFNCRCQIFSLSHRDLSRKDLEVSDLKRGDYIKTIDPKTGDTVAVKLEPDKGFDYVPGKSTKAQRESALKGLSPDLKQSVLKESEVEFKLPDGSTKRRNGANYVLSNSRWHRAEEQAKPQRSRAQRSADIEDRTQQFKRDMENPTYDANGKLLTYEDVAEKFLHDIMETGDRDRAEAIADKIDVSKTMDEVGTFKNAIDFYQLIDKDLHIKAVVGTDGRACAKESESAIELSDLRSIKDRRSTQFHEMAHFTEFTDPIVGVQSQQWVKDRANGAVARLNQITDLPYKNDEIAYPDNFADPYIGKVYDNRYMSEVMSMGLEAFSHPWSLANLYRDDSEHFDLIMKYIKK